MKRVYRALIFIFICEAVGLIGSVVTLSAIYLWYAGLIKPTFSPPNWLFGPVWTTLYLLMGIAVYLIWEKGIGKKKIKEAIFYFTVQLSLNFIWPFLFFGLHWLFISFLELTVLWFAILLTIFKFWKIEKTAASLLIPYILWVSFAAVLNYSLFVLNP